MEQEITCPQCSNISSSGALKRKKAFYNEAKDMWHCFLCNASGKGVPDGSDDAVSNVVSMQPTKDFSEDHVKFYEDSYASLALNHPAREYLLKRLGASPLSFDYRLGFDPVRNAIACPSYLGGSLKGIKFRFLDPNNSQRYISAKGSEVGFYIPGGVLADNQAVLLCEGEFDAISAKLLGFEGNVIAMQTNRVTNQIKDNLVKILTQATKVYLSLDNDEPGMQLAMDVSKLVPKNKICFVELPDTYKDLNDIIQLHGLDEGVKAFMKILENARPEVEKNTLDVDAAFQDMEDYLLDKDLSTGDPTPWTSFNDIMDGGFRPGDVTVVNAFAKTGKSSFLNNIICNYVDKGRKVALASFEMSPSRELLPAMLSILLDVNVRKVPDAELPKLAEYAHTLNDKLFFFNKFGNVKWEDVEAWIRYLHFKHNLNHIFLDHSCFMVKDAVDASQNQELAQNVKRLANEIGVHICVVVQAPKPREFDQELGLTTSYGGMAFPMNCTHYITLQRKKNEENQLHVRLVDSRNNQARPSHNAVILFYDRETCKLTDC